MADVKKRKAGERTSGPQKRAAKRKHLPRRPSSPELSDVATSGENVVGTLVMDPMIDPDDSPASSEGGEDVSEGWVEGVENEDGDGDDDDVEDFGGSVEEEAEEDDVEPEAGPSTTKPKPTPNGKSKYRPPTMEELETLRQTESSGGNTFALQLDALLTSTLLSKTPPAGLKDLLATIHSHIMSLHSLPALLPPKACKRFGQAIPFPGPDVFHPLKRADVKWTLGWEKPEEVIIGGSWGVCGGYRKGKKEMGDVNVVAVMPAALFSPKDRMDFRYFHKRIYYLAIIKKSLEMLGEKSGASLSGIKVRWEDAHGDSRRPIIVISAGKEQGLRDSVEISVSAAAPGALFQPSSLSPSKSLLRDAGIPESAQTPLYSTSIIQDTLHKAHLLHLHHLSQFATVDRMVDAFLALWRIWASRRGLQRHRGGSGWFASMLLGWVMDGVLIGGSGGDRTKFRREPGLGKSLTAWAALKAAWERIGSMDLSKRPVSLCVSQDPMIPLPQILESFSVALVDPTGSINIFAEWDEGDIELLQYHARETLALLEHVDEDHFSDVFLRNLSITSGVYDDFLTIDISSIRLDTDVLEESERTTKLRRASQAISSLLRRGLTDRVKLVHCSVDQDHPDSVHVGLIYNSSSATRVMDIGPSSDSKAEGQAFREFWGDKAELRRFKDGSISESVVWSIVRPEEATTIPYQIVCWLLQRHLDISTPQVTTFSAKRSWMDILQVDAAARDAINVAGSEKLGFRPILDGYEELYKLLKSIDNELPLSILQVQPASELLRYSTTFVPHPIDIARYPTAPDCLKYVSRAEIVVQFESSPRWPDDLAAIQKVKFALMEKLAGLVRHAQRDSTINIVFDPHASEIEDSAGLEILLGSGVAFLLRIYHERERTLLDRAIEGDAPAFGTSLPLPPRRLAIPALELHVRRFIHLPRHHATIAPLHHRYPSYSSACRLLKRWFSAHMLSLKIETEAIELLMAKVYLQPGSLGCPASAPQGFVRAIKVLTEWDWKIEPIILPLSGEAGKSGRPRMDGEVQNGIVRQFEARRTKDKTYLHSAWVIATEQDHTGLRWTSGISKVVANRVRSLARATLEAIRTATLSSELDIRALFTTPLADYDVLVHLHSGILPTYAQGVHADAANWVSEARFKNARRTVYGDEIRIAFDPALAFAQDIQRLYGDTLLVFFDQHGGQVIGLLWNPDKVPSRALKPFLGYSTKPSAGEAALVTLDKDAVITEIQRLGEGLIKSIVVK
ncbi:Nrap protein [Kockovaella imperatae]|uniref:U3 small nucleolar RNA-associated protein 22 n=1 Tax=Kockovaella imperatae TaxID=4999 RepID=A0A1Y1US24_9TREE|nr:Nrap protein [Kockovaella imperatae]ORX40762.1 Nrap protein [Kockovaella imperatae]